MAHNCMTEKPDTKSTKLVLTILTLRVLITTGAEHILVIWKIRVDSSCDSSDDSHAMPSLFSKEKQILENKNSYV